MAGAGVSPVEMISQLEAARKLALADAQVYLQVVPGILSIIGPNAAVAVRRWGADFIAEALSTPSLSNTQKEQLTSSVLPLLKSLLEDTAQDVSVVKSVVQAAASIYPLAFKRMYVLHQDSPAPSTSLLLFKERCLTFCDCRISRPEQQEWQDMSAIKLRILQRMDSAPLPVRICCIKFIQKVVHVETPGIIADPRVPFPILSYFVTSDSFQRPDQNETSIALVPRNHPLLVVPNLEAEASGLLDRLLYVFQDATVYVHHQLPCYSS